MRVFNAPDEIITELWQIKEEIAREHGYNVEALAAYLQTKPRREGQRVVDLCSLKEASETQHLARSKKNR